MTDLTAWAAVWVLITVTNGGAVHQETGFRTQAICEEAISLALYRKTLAEHEQDLKQRQQQEGKWLTESLTRFPKTDYEKDALNYSKSSWGDRGICLHAKNGLIYEEQRPCSNPVGYKWIIGGDNEIIYARCLPDPGEEKGR